MASAVIDSATANEPPLRLDSIPIIDLRLLSQSELYSLSLCTPSPFDPLRCDDIVTPTIDRSVFNESAGSRKQTFSRLRLAPSGSSQPIRHRTPHLRPTAASNPSFETDPEKAENSLIVNLLKRFFEGEGDAVKDELIPVHVEYSASVPDSLNAEPTGLKRKRGRPRKNESAKAEEFNVIKDVVVFRKAEDRDKELLNREGVAVDLIALGALADPYGQEIQRRTGGMGSQEELLGFLQGLNGQWVSRRRRKRIVDASDFGDALPKDWRIVLAVKKKEGRVWLYCRRYMSPNGRQFISCKEVSSYLLSLHNVHFPNHHSSARSDDATEVLIKPASPCDVVRIEYPAAQDIKTKEDLNSHVSSAGVASNSGNRDLQVIKTKEDLNSHVSSADVASDSGNRDLQVMLNPGDSLKVPGGDNHHCEKCNLIFKKNDDLIQHQITFHRKKRQRNGQSITDGVIIKGGIYECQLCHKTFTERRRYNGHMGAHVKNRPKNDDESSLMSSGQHGDSKSVVDNFQKGSLNQTSTRPDSGAGTEALGMGGNGNLNSLCLNNENQGIDCTDISNKVEKVHHSLGPVASESNGCSHSQENIKPCETSNNLHGAESFSDGRGCYTADRCLPAPHNTQMCSNEDNLIMTSCGLEELKQQTDPGNGLHSSDENLATLDVNKEGEQSAFAVDELKLDQDIFADKSEFGFCSSYDGPVENSLIAVPKIDNADVANDVLISTGTGSPLNKDSESTLLAPFGDVEVQGNISMQQLPGSAGTDKLVETDYFGCNDNGNYVEPDVDCLRAKNKMSMESCSVISSWNGQANMAEKLGDMVSSSLEVNLGPQKNSGSNLLSLSVCERNSDVDNYDAILTRNMEESKDVKSQSFRTNELIFPFGNSQSGLDVPFQKQDGSLQSGSLFPSGNGRSFGTNNVTGAYNSTTEGQKQDFSGTAFLSQSFLSEASQQAYTNGIYDTPLAEPANKDTENLRNQELTLAFGNSCRELDLVSNGLEQGRLPVNSTNIHSQDNQTYVVQQNLSTADFNESKNSNQATAFELDLSDLSFNGKAGDLKNNCNMVFPSRMWEESRVNESGNSANKFVIDFGSSIAQPHQDKGGGSIWKFGDQNLLQDSFANSSTSLVQPMSHLGSNEVVTDKGKQEPTSVRENYGCNTPFEGLRLGQAEPLEYSFMTPHSLSSLPEESKGFSYDMNVDQGFDSSFWIGRDAMMPNIASRNQVTTVCVWCRSEFYQEPIQSGTQSGAIGSMCPTCSARISEQFNM